MAARAHKSLRIKICAGEMVFHISWMDFTALLLFKYFQSDVVYCDKSAAGGRVSSVGLGCHLLVITETSLMKREFIHVVCPDKV